MSKKGGFSRRGFIKNTAVLGTAGLFTTTESASATGDYLCRIDSLDGIVRYEISTYGGAKLKNGPDAEEDDSYYYPSTGGSNGTWGTGQVDEGYADNWYHQGRIEGVEVWGRNRADSVKFTFGNDNGQIDVNSSSRWSYKIYSSSSIWKTDNWESNDDDNGDWVSGMVNGGTDTYGFSGTIDDIYVYGDVDAHFDKFENLRG